MSIPVQQVGVRQRKVEYLHFHVDISAVSAVATSTDGLIEGTYHGTILKNGTGDTTITLNSASKRKIHVVGWNSVGASGVAGTVDMRASFTAGTSTVQVVTESGGTDTDCDYDLTIAVFGVASQQ